MDANVLVQRYSVNDHDNETTESNFSNTDEEDSFLWMLISVLNFGCNWQIYPLLNGTSLATLIFTYNVPSTKST